MLNYAAESRLFGAVHQSVPAEGVQWLHVLRCVCYKVNSSSIVKVTPIIQF